MVALGDVQGVETERCRVVGEIGKSGVVVVLDFRLSMIIDGFFDCFEACGCACEAFEHVNKARIGGFPNHVGGGDHYWRWCRYVDRGGWDDRRDSGGTNRISFGLYGQDSVAVSTTLSYGLVFVGGEVHNYQGDERGKWMWGNWMTPFCDLGPPFMSVWVLLPRWGIGDRSRRLVLGRVSGAPQVPRYCRSWGNPST